MLIELHRQLHSLLRRRRGQLLLTLLAALWLALPWSAATSNHATADTASAQSVDNHCEHHSQTDINTNTYAHSAPHGSGHHGENHNCHCAQACHASPIAIVTTGLNLPPPTHTTQPIEQSQQLASTLQPPLYRPPITLAV